MIEDTYFNQHYTGFGLYDPALDQYLYQKNIDKYFTPASNTKIFTLYASLHIIRDRISTFKYYENQDSVVIWGTGNPALLHPQLPVSSIEHFFLKSLKHKSLFFSNQNFQDQKYGPGWSWDDALYTYQLEKTVLPLYGNKIKVTGIPNSRQIVVEPRYFEPYIYAQEDTTRPYGSVQRNPESNLILYNNQIFDTTHNERYLPIRFSPQLSVDLLQDTLAPAIQLIDVPFSKYTPAKTIYSETPVDSIYRIFMQNSDNFIGEQLLLNCSMEVFDTMNTQKFIHWAKDSLFQGSPDSLIWVDGSGLSRYNMFTPQTIIHVLDSIYNLKSFSWIKEVFPGGGESGTIQNWYKSNRPEPYVWAKTGTLRHNHCLSGFIKCLSGKVLIFSFMHNHFVQPSAKVKEEMEQVLEFIRIHY